MTIADGAIKCGLCGRDAIIKCVAQPGYQQPLTYGIVHCRNCYTAHALPLQSVDRIYEIIYKNIERIPGYARYAQYAERVLSEEDPLGYLQASEDAYWAIGNYIGEKDRPDDLKILEVGCGRGYLTYALARRGYPITGLDISRKAIDDAIRQYGAHYVCADVSDYSKTHAGQFNLVVMAEVIEHVPCVKTFMETITLLLTKTGEVILTTPNRSCYHESILWATETPPVHLWWFSEKSISYLAAHLNCSLRFINFHEYSQGHRQKLEYALSPSLPTRGPILDSDGEVLGDKEQYVAMAEYRRLTPRKLLLKAVNQVLRFRKDVTEGGARRTTLCAVLTKK